MLYWSLTIALQMKSTSGPVDTHLIRMFHCRQRYKIECGLVNPVICLHPFIDTSIQQIYLPWDFTSPCLILQFYKKKCRFEKLENDYWSLTTFEVKSDVSDWVCTYFKINTACTDISRGIHKAQMQELHLKLNTA